MRRVFLVISALLVAAIMIGAYLFISGNREAFVTYSADSYVKESTYLINAFHNSTGSSVTPPISGGSYSDAHNIAAGDPANVFISVSLASYGESYLGSRYSGWAVAFAADQLVLAYSSSFLSAASLKIIDNFTRGISMNNSSYMKNAFDMLTSGSVKVGISNASSDPAGLRAMLSLEIAGYDYANGSTGYYVDRMNSSGCTVTAADASILVSPLQEGSISFLYIYKSAAISDGLRYITLPNNMNFGDASYSSFYSSFSYNTASGSCSGAPIYLYVGALSNNSMNAESLAFIDFVINNSASMASFGLQPLSPALVFSNVGIPASLIEMNASGTVVFGGNITRA